MSKPRILCDTKAMSRERWLECRKHGPDGNIPVTIGGSDIATVMGINPYAAPLDFWLDKKGLRPFPEPDRKALMRMKIGTVMEPLIAEMYGDETGNLVIEDTNLYQHPKHDFALVNLDYRFEEYSGITGPLECKNTISFNADQWKDGIIPAHYEAQGRWQMSIMDSEVVDFSAFWGSGLATPRLERDLGEEKRLYDYALEFIESLKSDTPPSITGISSELALKALASLYEANAKDTPTIEFGAKHELQLRRIAELQEQASKAGSLQRKLNKELDELTVPIADMMREHKHGVLEIGSERLEVSYIPRRKMLVNNEALKKEFPEIHKSVQRPSVSRKVKVEIIPIEQESLPKAG